MHMINLFNLMDLWFGREAAAKAWDASWGPVRHGWRMAKSIAHMQASLAILYREKWGTK